MSPLEKLRRLESSNIDADQLRAISYLLKGVIIVLALIATAAIVVAWRVR